MIQDNNIDDKMSLASGETYIMFNNLKGYITVWINCDREMAINITKDDLVKISPTLFPAIKLSELLTLLQRGNYVFTDKFSVKVLKSKQPEISNILPSFEDVSRNLKVNQRKLATPFGITF